jgi:plastocyanin
MFTSLRRGHGTLFLTGMLAWVGAAACSKGGEPPRSTESAASNASVAATPEGSQTDSAAPARADTTTPARAEPSTAKTAPESSMSKTPPEKPLPKPSIDPGRKPAKRLGDSTAKAKAPSGTPAAAPAPAPAPAAAPEPAQGAARDKWLKYDAASNTVTFELIAGPFNFNEFTSGGATLTVPSKANVVMNFVNKDGTPHSAEIISGEGPVPNAAVDPAIPRAYTNKVLEGLPQEASDVMRFTVPESGKYRIFCGVPGHGLSGMWIWMVVDPAAKAPSFGPTKA